MRGLPLVYTSEQANLTANCYLDTFHGTCYNHPHAEIYNQTNTTNNSIIFHIDAGRELRVSSYAWNARDAVSDAYYVSAVYRGDTQGRPRLYGAETNGRGTY